MDEIGKRALPLMAITAMFTACLPIFALVAYLAVESEAEAQDPLASAIVLLLSTGIMALGYGLKPAVLKALGRKLGEVGSVGKYMTLFFPVHIVSLVIREAGVLIAFAFSFTTEDPTWVTIAAGIGVVLNIADFPTKSRLEALISQGERGA